VPGARPAGSSPDSDFAEADKWRQCLGRWPSYQQLAKGVIAQHLAEGGEDLIEDILPVGHEQQVGAA